tara:strand:- start:570 stop:1214 length:645 start_codon:yes stop_codon:yes gene_type:complete
MALKVKICGLKTINQVNESIKGNAKMIGLMFYNKSPRHIDIKTAKKLSMFAEKKISRVGIFANMKISEIKKIVENVRLDYLQFHGNETINFLEDIKKKTKIKIIKAVKIINNNDIKRINAFRNICNYILIDSKIVIKNNLNFKKKTKELNWKLLKNIRNKSTLILSGALDIENLEKAIKMSNIRFVDVSSSIETSPGKKNIKKINKFLKLASKL